MEPITAFIPARSKKQALDWSLVLVSQGIESTIEPAAAEGGWHLVVDGNDSQRAFQTLRQYKAENGTPAWRQTLPWTGLVFDWRSLAWVVLLAAIFILQETPNSTLTHAGMMDSQAVRSGQWWRLFTAVTIHRDIAHLAANLTTGFLLLGLALGSFGSGVGLLAAYLAGTAGNLAGLLLYGGEHHSLGASGMIFGALGLISGQMAGLLRAGFNARQVAIRSGLSGFLLLVLFGLNPESDVVAHLGGFFAGVLFGALLAQWPKRLAGSSLANRLAEFLCAGLVILTWWLAVAR